jgi:uncharacterized protein (TIGR03032 family)
MSDQPASSTPASSTEGAQQEAPRLEIMTSRGFNAWLVSQRASLAVTTYQAGKILFLGVNQQGKLSVFERTLDRVMGMTYHGGQLWVSTLYQVWRFVNLLRPGENHQGYDALFYPRQSFVTGDLDIHDMVMTEDGQLVFANTLFNCLATLDAHHSFKPVWKPDWISKLVAEDRCHLNGMALREGKPGFVTAVSRSDVNDGWRDRRRDGGVVVDVQKNRVIADGFSMPHSPRWYRDKLWLLNSGTGYFGSVDPESGEFEPLVFCPGYARGLAFVNNFAVVGLSDRRKNRTFQDLDLEDNLKEKDAEARCGLLIIDLEKGEAPHWLRFEGAINELYDVAVLPGFLRPMAIGFKSNEIQRIISHD